MHSLAVLLVASLWVTAATPKPKAVPAIRTLGDLGKVGAVTFPTSCDPAVQPEFERGVALLHSFYYAEARKAFEAVAARDPGCAMAYWGIAMTYYHPIGSPPDSSELAAGTAAVQKAIAAPRQDAREREFVHAIQAYYQGLDVPQPAAAPVAPSCHGAAPADFEGRATCFRREMEAIAQRRPGDVEVAAFYALSLLGTAPASDVSLGHQKKAATLLEPWFARLPDHPGLAHYLIHCYDYPATAKKGLAAARAYADIAPWVPHALHMPSHIFTRLGMWSETIRSNLAAAEAARKAPTPPGVACFEELHALDYAVYGYLQTGQNHKAKAIVDYLASLTGTEPAVDAGAAYAYGAIPARYALERRQWKEAAALEMKDMPFSDALPFAEGHRAYARAVGGAKSGNVAVARAAAQRLDELAKASTDPRFAHFRQQMELQRRAAMGLIAIAEGRQQSGLEQLRLAAISEDSLGRNPVSPGAMLPIRELYAEALLDARYALLALAEFEASLAIYPARFNGVFGAARAAEVAGKRDEAKRYYLELVRLNLQGDGSRTEMVRARAYLTNGS